jgi:N-acetyl-anhydromuramyl-L-alanine amidase AmpD
MTNKLLSVRHKLRRAATAFGAIAALVFAFGGCMTAYAQGIQTSRQQLFASAAQEFGVPENVLLALSYNESHWISNAGMSSDGGYGLMDLRTYQGKIVSGRDGATVTPAKQSASYYTLDQAATLLNVSSDMLKTDNQQNIRGAAAVLAQDAKQLNNNSLPASIKDWYSAVAEFSGASSVTAANLFATDVFATIKGGASLTTADGQIIDLPALASVQPNVGSISKLGLKDMPTSNSMHSLPECPSSLDCRFIPAAYAPDDPNDPTNYGNFDYANRPADMQIKYIYIHDGEGSYSSIVNHFQDPLAYDSAQYVISSQGDITQMVRNQDVSWGVGNWNMNMHGINIEHAGFAAQGASWYTPAMYQASATLVHWLANKYHIPLDRQHILGHDNIMKLIATAQAVQHWDPGPYWDWNYYMDLVKGGTPEQAAADYTTSSTASLTVKKGDVVTISPNFAGNQPVITDCQSGTCVTLPKQGASFVYLHTQPSNNAPLLTDPYLHGQVSSDPYLRVDGSVGNTQDNDWGDKAPSGFKYVVAEVRGDWTAIWYAGQVGWFYNPHGDGRTARVSSSETLTPRPGLSSIPVYTVAYPEASAYPSVIPIQSQQTAYSMPAGQAYSTTSEAAPGDYFYDWTWNYSMPDDHMIVRGNQKYYEITFNHHVGFVKTGDVAVTPDSGK